MAAPAWTLSALGAVTLALAVRDPHQTHSWGQCPSAALGFWCPGCGGLRAVNDLTQGHVGAAASSNLLLILAMPFLIAGLAVWTIDRWRGTTHEVPPRIAKVALPAFTVAVLAFTLVRNLPVGGWLAP